MNDYLVVVAIDIGKTYSTSALSFKNSPTDVIGGNPNKYKVTTVVLFNQNGEFHSIGNDAEDHFKQLKDEEKKDWYYFKDFHHISNEHKPTEFEIAESSGKKLETYKVYGSIIRLFKNQFYTTFPEVRENDVHFVLTVLPVFSRSHNRMLREAFSFAGIKTNYSLVNEPEAILSYWEHMWDKEQKLPNNVDLKNGDGFLLVNLKGTTATITSNEMKHGVPERRYFIYGGGWGGQAAYEEFKQFFIKIVGAPVFLRSIEEGCFNNLDLQASFEEKSKHFGKRQRETFRIPFIAAFYEEEYNENINNVVQESPFSKSVTFMAGKVLIETSYFKGFFKKTLETIVSNIKNILFVHKHIKVIVMIGYFSEFELVQDGVQSAFPDCCFLFPIHPEFTILKGAVLKGHNTPTNIVAEHTYFAHMLHINDECDFPEVLEEVTKTLIEKGEHIHKGEERDWIFELNTFDMEYVEIIVYTSPKHETYASVSLHNEDVKIVKKERIAFNGAHRIQIQVKTDFERDARLSRIYITSTLI